MLIKKIITLALSASVFLSPFAYSQPNVSQFLQDYDDTLKLMLQSYHEQVKEPLEAKIFDISQPLYYSFLKNSTHRDYNEFLAMMFYKDFQINQQPTSFCFILYDAKKIEQLDLYLNHVFPKPQDAVLYLAAHELGHCIASHQRVLGHIADEPNHYKEEQIADMFALGLFLSRKDNEQALSVIREIKRQAKEDVHANGDELSQFYIEFQTDAPKSKNMADLFNITYQYYLKINQNK